MQALDRYAAFSNDGYAFADAETSPGAGIEVLTFYAVPTGTVEKRMVLDSAAARQRAAADLAADGFPRPGAPARLPPGFSTEIQGAKVTVTLAGQPVTHPFVAFPSLPNVRPGKARILAVSSDGSHVAVRVESATAVGEFGPARVVRVVPLFK